MKLFSRHNLIKVVYVVIDVVLLFAIFYLASWIRRVETLPFNDITFSNLFVNEVNPFRNIYLFWIFVTVIVNNSQGLYETKREIIETVEVWRVVKAACISTLIAIVAIYIIKIEDFPRSILILVTFFMSVLFSIWRVIKRIFVEYIVSRGYNNYNALIIGAGKVGRALAKEIKKRKGLGINVVGYLDDFKECYSDLHGLMVIGKIKDFSRVVRSEFINEVFITIHHDGRVFLDLIQQAKELGIAIRVIPQGFNLMSSDFYKFDIGFIPILEYCNVKEKHRQFGKRLFDFISSLILITLTLPVFVMVALLVKINSPGPIFYISKRYGRGGKKFNMYKFRSMRKDAEKSLGKYKEKNEVDGPIFKIRNDPRITRLGRWLRKYSLDELPQLINVLKGDMSLVGPRPLPLNQVQREDFKQLKRLEVRPGITGLWQIRGRSDLSFARLIKWDVFYINNWSFRLDLVILLRTFPAVIKGKGAY